MLSACVTLASNTPILAFCWRRRGSGYLRMLSSVSGPSQSVWHNTCGKRCTRPAGLYAERPTAACCAPLAWYLRHGGCVVFLLLFLPLDGCELFHQEAPAHGAAAGSTRKPVQLEQRTIFVDQTHLPASTGRPLRWARHARAANSRAPIRSGPATSRHRWPACSAHSIVPCNACDMLPGKARGARTARVGHSAWRGLGR